jgi:hypothetical protein
MGLSSALLILFFSVTEFMVYNLHDYMEIFHTVKTDITNIKKYENL